MGKRSDFERLPKDFYPTIDHDAIPPNFIKFIQGCEYAEPCYGMGDLEKLLKPYASCMWSSDIDEDSKAAFNMSGDKIPLGSIPDCIITNPPYKRSMLDPLLDHWLKSGKDTWLLLPHTQMVNKTFAKYMEKCSKVVAVGRLFWFKSKWVEEEPISIRHSYKWFRKKHISMVDHMKGIIYYSGWWDEQNNRPTQGETMKGTDDYCWYCFNGEFNGTTEFYTRGN